MLHGAWYALIGLSLRDDAMKVAAGMDPEELSALAAQIVQFGMSGPPR